MAETTNTTVPSMDAFEAFSNQTQALADAEANRTSTSGNNNQVTYEEQKWVGLDQGKYHIMRIVGNPPESMTPGFKAADTDAHEIYYSEIKADDGKKFQLRLPVRGDLPEKDHLIWRIIDKVLTVTWTNKVKSYKYQDKFPDIFNKVKFGGWDSSNPAEAKNHQYSKGWAGQKIVLMNVIDREDNWCAENKHTKLLARQITTKQYPDGTVAEFVSKGIPSYGFLNKLGGLVANYKTWENYDIGVKRTGIKTEPYQIINATAFVNGKIPEIPQDKIPLVNLNPLTEEEKAYERYNIAKLFGPVTYAKIDAKLGASIKLIDACLGTNFYTELQTLKAEEAAKWEAEKAEKEAAGETETAAPATTPAAPVTQAVPVQAPVNQAPISEAAPVPTARRAVAPAAPAAPTIDTSLLKGYEYLTPEQKAEIVSVTKKADGALDIVYRSADGSPVTTVPCPICGAAGLMSHHHCVACGTEFKDE